MTPCARHRNVKHRRASAPARACIGCHRAVCSAAVTNALYCRHGRAPRALHHTTLQFPYRPTHYHLHHVHAHPTHHLTPGPYTTRFSHYHTMGRQAVTFNLSSHFHSLLTPALPHFFPLHCPVWFNLSTTLHFCTAPSLLLSLDKQLLHTPHPWHDAY